MPDALPLSPAGTALQPCPQTQCAAARFRQALATGHRLERAMEELEAYLVALRPGLPRVLAREQAEAIAAAVGAVPQARRRPPLPLLIRLAMPVRSWDIA